MAYVFSQNEVARIFAAICLCKANARNVNAYNLYGIYFMLHKLLSNMNLFKSYLFIEGHTDGHRVYQTISVSTI